MPRGKKRTLSQTTGRHQAPPQPGTDTPTQAQGPMIAEARRHPSRRGGLSGRFMPTSATTAPTIEIDQNMLMDAIQEFARDANTENTLHKLKGLVENLVALVDHNKDDKDQAGSVRTELLNMTFFLVKEDFSTEQDTYGTLVWQSPKLIRSMQVLLVIYVSAMPYRTFELSGVLPQLLEFSKSLLTQFITMNSLNLESHVITLATLYLRIYYSYHKGTASAIGEDFSREIVFELLHKYNDNYIWQGNPIEFLKELPNTYNLIWTTLPHKDIDNLIDSIFKTSTKDHLKGLYADSIVLGWGPLSDNSSDGSNLDLEYLYTFIEDPSKDPKKTDRSLDILCQIITCNNHNYTILFPPKEMIEVYILPMLYHDEVYIKVRTCHLIAVWVKSFIFRYPYGPDKDDILSSIVERLFSVINSDSNLAVHFAISRCIISLLGCSTGQKNWIPIFLLQPAVIKLVETYSNFPHECSPLLAANLMLSQFPDTLANAHAQIFESLCNLLKQTCKSFSFYKKYGLMTRRCNSQDIKKSLIDTLKGLEVVLDATGRTGKHSQRAFKAQVEDKLLGSLKHIYIVFQDRNLKVNVAALHAQAALQRVICTKRSSNATKRYVLPLLERIKKLPPDEFNLCALDSAESIMETFNQF